MRTLIEAICWISPLGRQSKSLAVSFTLYQFHFQTMMQMSRFKVCKDDTPIEGEAYEELSDAQDRRNELQSKDMESVYTVKDSEALERANRQPRE